MFNKKVLFCLFVWSALLSFAFAQDENCNKCLTNGAYCIDASSFYFCPDGENPDIESGKIPCPEDTFCSNEDAICDATETNAACTASAGCGGECSATTKMVCESRTQYSICIGEEKTTRSCPEGQACSVALYSSDITPKKICAPEATLEFLNMPITCNEEPTPAPSTTPNPNALSQACAAAEKEENPNNARYFYIHNPTDINCHTYIYCEKSNSGLMQGVLFTCPNNTYWDKTTRKCQATKPSSCNVTTTTTTTTTTTQRPPVF